MAYDITKLIRLGALKALAERAEAAYAKKTAVEALQDTVTGIVTTGGEVNVIERVTVNGQALAVTDKTVDVPVPTAVSGLSNDSGYQTAGQVSAAIQAAVGASGGGLEEKADKAVPAAENNLAALDASGNLADSGIVLDTATNTIDANTTGNAATATKLAATRTVRTNLASTAAASFDGSGNITPGVTGTLPAANGGTGTTTGHIAVTSGTNTTSTASPAHGGTFTAIDSVTRDTYGHVTAVNTKTVTLPSDNNTDTKVTQTVTTTSASYPLLLAPSGQTATTTTTAYFASGVTLNPSSKTLTCSTFSGALSGNATTATTATKLGSSTVGGTAKPIYLSSGTATACSSTVGSGTKPVYMSSGTITASGSTVGGAGNPVYMSSGTVTATGIFKLLYTNSSPTSAFAAQTLTVSSLSSYNLILVMSRWNTSENYLQGNIFYVPSTSSTSTWLGNTYEYSSTWYTAYRNLTFVRSSNQITISAANYNGAANNTTYLIPVYILGAVV